MSKNRSCPSCGNNPVPHFVNWYFESINVLFTPIRQFLLDNFLTRLAAGLFSRVNISWLLVSVFKTLGVVAYQPDILKCKVRRAQVLWEEAEKRGMKMTELLLFGRPFDTYLVSNSQPLHPHPSTLTHKFPLVFSGLPRPTGSSAAATDIMDDKAILKKRLKAAGLPVPEGDSVVSFWGALQTFHGIEKPVIVKPRAGSRGRHSTTFIYDERELKKAFHIAKQLCFWVVVEEHLQGPVYRATVINGKLCGVLRGDSPQVTGDGVKTIVELVKFKNGQPHPGVQDIVLDDRSEIFLSRQGYHANSVLEKNKTISLTEKIGVSYGGSSSEDLEICHPDNQELFAAAARAVGDPIVGFDFIIPDIAKSWRDQKCGFIEANSLPFINLHHDPLKGTPQNVAAEVWNMI